MDVISRSGHSALALAAEAVPESSSTEAVRVLLHNGAPLEAGDGLARSTSPLVASACTGRVQVATQLLEAGALVDAADGMGRRALPCAAAAGNLALCKLLLESRANANGYGTSGAKNAEVGRGVTAVCIAAAGGNTDLVRLLLAAHADVETLDERGRTPLMAAAQCGVVSVCTALCETLVTTRASLDARQVETGKTALIFAASMGHSEVCMVLVEAAADPNAQALTGATSLHAAAANGHEGVCQCLVKMGATVELLGPGAHTAEALATTAGHIALGSYLRGHSSAGSR